MSRTRPPATADELLAAVDDVHPSMVPSYLAQGVLTALIEVRDDLRAVLAELRTAGAPVLPEQRARIDQ